MELSDPRIDQTIDDLGYMLARKEAESRGHTSTAIELRAQQIASSIRAFVTAQANGYTLTIEHAVEFDPDDPIAEEWGRG